MSGLLNDPIGEAAKDLSALGGVLICLSCNEVHHSSASGVHLEGSAPMSLDTYLQVLTSDGPEPWEAR